MQTHPHLMLTPVGHRKLLAMQRASIVLDETGWAMAELCQHGVQAAGDVPDGDLLIERGWARVAPDGIDAEGAHLACQRNPLEHIDRINFEITTQCDFACLHCRNGGVTVQREKNMPALEDAGRLFLSLGIRRFDFIGGEVMRYGKGWLDLAAQLRADDAGSGWPDPLVITVFTSGWWLGLRDFAAAGRHYDDEAALLADLRAHGVSHVLFSIDGPEERHDRWRRHPGLFRRIAAGIGRVKAAGVEPRLSVVVMEGDSYSYLKPLATAIYDQGDNTLRALATDPFNQFSNFIDSGRAADNLRSGVCRLSDMHAGQMRCKAFFRPSPTLRIMAGGNLGICPLMQGEEGYGNIHRTPLVELLNRLPEAPLYRLHASGAIGNYRASIDPERFAQGVDHLCAVRIEANRLALADPDWQTKVEAHEALQAVSVQAPRNLSHGDFRRSQPVSAAMRAAAALKQADALIVSAGAGMGVDSGLPDFRGPQGFWGVYPALGRAGIRFEQIANPQAFREHLARAWGFYGHRLALYRATAPGPAFSILQAIAARLPHGAFAFTSNVDGHFQMAGFGADRVWECHGSIHHLQCLDGCTRTVWSARDFVPEVDAAQCLLQNAPPTCPQCGGPARPNILMFGDFAWVDGREQHQEARYRAWRKNVHQPVVIEIGAGTAIPTVRHFSDTQPDAFVIRINPTEPALGSGTRGVSLALAGTAALQEIAAALLLA